MALLQRTVTEVATVPEAAPCGRPEARGKFLFLGQEKLYVRGVTYGTFEPDADGVDYPSPVVVKRDFQSMAAAGVNAVRTYTVPPRWQTCGILSGVDSYDYSGYGRSRIYRQSHGQSTFR